MKSLISQSNNDGRLEVYPESLTDAASVGYVLSAGTPEDLRCSSLPPQSYGCKPVDGVYRQKVGGQSPNPLCHGFLPVVVDSSSISPINRSLLFR